MQTNVTLYFIRHGQTDWNAEQRYQGQTNIPLNDTGRAQARRNGLVLGDSLGHEIASYDMVSSPLERATETMEIVREAMGLPRRPYAMDPRLAEQNFGHWEGQKWSELPKADPEGFASRQADTWNWTPRGGENYEMVRVRVLAWLDELERDTIAVSHGNISRSVRGILLGLDPQVVPKLEVPQDRILCIKNGSAAWL
jgi:broad specificity phosphatase PhoE